MSKPNNTNNVSTYGTDILRAAGLNKEKATKSVELAHCHGERYAVLLPLVRAEGANVRDILIKDWNDTPAAEDFVKKYDAMAKLKDKTPVQAEQFKSLQDIKANLNTTLTRAIDTYEGMSLLRELGYVVKVRRLPGLGNVHIYLCNISYVDESVAEEERNDEPVPFVAAELMRVAAVVKAGKLDAAVDTAQLKTLLSPTGVVPATTGSAPNGEKAPGNGTLIDVAAMPQAIASLDTAISTHLTSDGHSLVGSKSTNDAMDDLWAKLNATIPEDRKARAMKRYAATMDTTAKDKAATALKVQAAAAKAAKELTEAAKKSA